MSKPQIIDPTDTVLCVYCKKPLSKSSDDCVNVTSKSYAHKHCAELESQRELTDSEKLDKYIMKLFDVEFVPPSVRKQINKFVDEYNYTYSGIQKSLIYFYEVKKNSIENARGMISIVPYIYQDAYRYYYSLWEARQKNERKQIKDYIPEVKEIIIPVPHTETKRRKLFSFLDEEE